MIRAILRRLRAKRDAYDALDVAIARRALRLNNRNREAAAKYARVHQILRSKT